MQMRYEIEIQAPASAAWQVLGEGFGDLSWASTIVESRLIGALEPGGVRSCTGTGFGPFPPSEIEETLIHFDAEARTFTYQATRGLPAFIVSAQNTWQIQPSSPDRCTVILTPKVQVRWWFMPLQPLLPWMLKGSMQKLIEEMQHRIETGQVHPRAHASNTVEATP